MKTILFCLFIFLNAPCFSSVTSIDFQRFLKEYHDPQRKSDCSWSEISYAIERDDDAMALFCIDKLPLGQISYQIGQVNYMTTRAYCYNLFCRCVKKNKIEILRAICEKYPDLKPGGSEYIVQYSHGGNTRSAERQILNIAIERNNGLEWVKLLAFFGADLNVVESYYSDIVRDDHSRTPLQEAIFKNRLNIAEFLLERNVDPNTGLLTAVTGRNKEALVLLLNFGADPYYNNGYILREALRLGHDEIVAVLADVYFSK